MNFLLTGTSGFIGKHLAKALCETYGSSNIFALSSRHQTNLKTAIYSQDDFSISREDISFISKANIIIHAGSFTPKCGKESNLLEPCVRNIEFTKQLLNIPFENLEKIIYLSTIDVYNPDHAITELTKPSPETLYGISKLFCEKTIEKFGSEIGASTQILRIGHVYGPGEEFYRKFIPVTIRRLIGGEPIEIWGDGSDLRSFIFVNDVIEAIKASINLTERFNLINVVSGNSFSIAQILRILIEISRKDPEILYTPSTSKQRNFVFDNSRMKSLLLSSETDFVTGLQLEYDYFKSLK